ncbi:MAG TPA: hypothetical protein VF814_11630 [Casimicrobiaceae bacterium]
MLRELISRLRRLLVPRRRVVGCSLVEQIKLQEATPMIVEKFERGPYKYEIHMLPVVKKGKKR